MKPIEPCGWKYNIDFIPFQENVKFGRMAKISQGEESNEAREERTRKRKEKKKTNGSPCLVAQKNSISGFTSLFPRCGVHKSRGKQGTLLLSSYHLFTYPFVYLSFYLLPHYIFRGFRHQKILTFYQNYAIIIITKKRKGKKRK